MDFLEKMYKQINKRKSMLKAPRVSDLSRVAFEMETDTIRSIENSIELLNRNFIGDNENKYLVLDRYFDKDNKEYMFSIELKKRNSHWWYDVILRVISKNKGLCLSEFKKLFYSEDFLLALKRRIETPLHQSFDAEILKVLD